MSLGLLTDLRDPASASTCPRLAARAHRPTPTASTCAPRRAPRKPMSARGYSPPVPVDSKLPTFWLIGDSTVRNGSPGNGSTNAPDGQWGWGAPLTFYFDPAKVNVVNRALGGTSARSFLYIGNLKSMAALIKKGDVVIMQFGTNDGGPPPTSVGELKSLGEENPGINRPLGQKRKPSTLTAGICAR